MDLFKSVRMVYCKALRPVNFMMFVPALHGLTTSVVESKTVIVQSFFRNMTAAKNISFSQSRKPRQ